MLDFLSNYKELGIRFSRIKYESSTYICVELNCIKYPKGRSALIKQLSKIEQEWNKTNSKKLLVSAKT